MLTIPTSDARPDHIKRIYTCSCGKPKESWQGQCPECWRHHKRSPAKR